MRYRVTYTARRTVELTPYDMGLDHDSRPSVDVVHDLETGNASDVIATGFDEGTVEVAVEVEEIP